MNDSPTIRDAVPDHLAEVLGTFCEVFAGCGAIVIDALNGGAAMHPVEKELKETV